MEYWLQTVMQSNMLKKKVFKRKNAINSNPGQFHLLSSTSKLGDLVDSNQVA